MGCKNEELDLIPGRTKTFFLLQNVQNGSGVHPASYAVGMRGTFQAYHLLTSYTKVKSGSVPLFQHTFLACAETTLPTFPLLRIVCNVWDIFHILSDEINTASKQLHTMPSCDKYLQASSILWEENDMDRCLVGMLVSQQGCVT
jgi:hypothetical protein